MHAGVCTRQKVLLIGAGIGITPMRAILEDLPPDAAVTILHRVSSRAELILGDEIEQLAAQRGARYVVLAGRRVPGRDTWLPEQAAHLSDAEGLRQVVPDVAERDVYICGAERWMAAATAAAVEAGVPAAAIHVEHFTY